MTENLEASLMKFQKAANLHPQIPQLIKTWDRDIVIELSDIEEQTHVVQVRSGQMQLVSSHVSYTQQPCPQILLKGTYSLLTTIFEGELSPAEAYFNGDLECYASDQDQVKLDAISLILWGV